MSASIKPVVSISDYISHSGSYSSQASQLHGTLAQVKQMKADTIKQSIYDPYRESLLRWAQQEEKERQREGQREAKQKMKDLMARTGKTEKQIMKDWAWKRGYNLDTALRLFGGKTGLRDAITGDYSY